MRTVTLDRFTRSTVQSLRDAQHERIAVVRRGKPYALVVGIHDWEAEDTAFATSPDF
jgi:PHD/YefM family antitoxin component YafN of YafNO toxin-antitoxin module